MTVDHDFNSEDILFPIESMSSIQYVENNNPNNINNDVIPYSLDIKNTVLDSADLNDIQNQETSLNLGLPPLSFDSPLPVTETIPSTTDNSLHLKADSNKIAMQELLKMIVKLRVLIMLVALGQINTQLLLHLIL